MTELEWLTCEKPDLLLRHLKAIGATRWERGKRRRRLRLLGCAAFGQARHLLREDRGCRVIELAERYADSAAQLPDLFQLQQELQAVAAEGAKPQVSAEWGVLILLTDNDLVVAELALDYSLYGPEWEAAPKKPSLFRKSLRRVQASLVRDIFGNPFRPVAFDPRWRTADVVALARGIYEDRAFDRLPLLTDALMDAGCDHEDVLAHCRSDGPHVRGCWVVDLVLGKE